MRNVKLGVLFDKRDETLLKIVNDVLEGKKPLNSEERRFYPHLHPRGIKEMAESRGLRIAYAVIHVLETLEVGKFEDRLSALRSLRDEVLNASTGPLPKNTARVLLQIMKELVRSHGDYHRQLELAHDFRITATGKPRIVRSQLRRYYLLEMPEDWSQVSFDDHVHDVTTKGRKSATHLIMDAWIKGIRDLRVIYYNFVESRSVAELLEAAAVMGISVRIGIEFSAPHRGKLVKFIWTPRGFSDAESFLEFLREPHVKELMDEGRKVSEYQRAYVLEMLELFNKKHLPRINDLLGLSLAPLDSAEFNVFVRTGQASLLHLAKFIHVNAYPLMKKRVAQLWENLNTLDEKERESAKELVENMNRLDVDGIKEEFLSAEKNPELPDPDVIENDENLPPLLRLSPRQLLQGLSQLRTGYRVTLNLSGLVVEDVIELLYDCQGMVTRLEIFNLKDFAEKKTAHIPKINALQVALNETDVIALKRIIRHCLESLKTSAYPDREERIEKLREILFDIANFKSFYQGRVLKSRIGSDSTGQSPSVHGMGLAVIETLPFRAQKDIKNGRETNRAIVPMQFPVRRRSTEVPHTSSAALTDSLFRTIRKLPGLQYIGYKHVQDWEKVETDIRVDSPGNIVTLGGVQPDRGNEFSLKDPSTGSEKTRHRIGWNHLNSRLKNSLKILLGFIPAFLTFFLTYDWWVLAYMGAFIWFGITGVRNVIQSVLGGGGFKRSPLLKWNDYISWDRISDSLLFTGWSVPLLDLVVKNLILDRLFQINTATNPLALYSFMALANGIYLSSHNAFRGLPRAAIQWNFFRSVLSIPIAIFLNWAVGSILISVGVAQAAVHLQRWAAVISKAASDTVAGLIEGTADRHLNINLRLSDYRNKLKQVFDTYAELELLYPEVQVLETLRFMESKRSVSKSRARELRKILILHSLDLLYFWMYQPRARVALCSVLGRHSEEELMIVMQCHYLLKQQREIGQMFLDGIISQNFSRGLSFYLDRSPDYLKSMEKLIKSSCTMADNPLEEPVQ